MRKLTRAVENGFTGPVVETQYGLIRGVRVEGTYIFRGVPYARARRFRAPSAPEPWSGVRRAENFGTVCFVPVTPWRPDLQRRPRYYYPQSEDCLYLNIWTQSKDPAARRPVMVWLHGGWSSGHSGEEYAADGENLSAAGDVVVVGVNHRLHFLGCLDLSGCGEEYAMSGLAGAADLVAALEWIKGNISAFGGDPDNVTVFGHSGGGDKVMALMSMPAAAGLFHKAIMDAGGLVSPPAQPGAAGELAALVLERMGLTAESAGELDRADLYDLAAGVREAMGIYEARHGVPFRMGPAPDGVYLPEYRGRPLSGGRDIPMLVGCCGGDLSRVMSCRRFCAERAADGAAPVWSWVFDLKPPAPEEALWQGAETPYVFRNACWMEAQYEPGVSERVERAMSGAWTAFAGTGDPNHPGIPRWEPCSAGRTPTMVFDRECRAAGGAPEERGV